MRTLLTLFFCLSASIANADKTLELYFSNDSINGFQLSDAYETHNMGATYVTGSHEISLDLGIVSPDMLVYRNQFRVANRSYGEIATLSYINKLERYPSLSAGFYIKSSGKFSLDKAQAFAHKLFKLAKVDEINEIVRMPDRTWYGILAKFESKPSTVEDVMKFNSVSTTLGSDRASVEVLRNREQHFKNFNFMTSYGVEVTAFDDVISSEPIGASPRKINPIATFGVETTVANMELYLQQRLSLPTITGDDSVYAVVTAGVRHSF